MTVTGVPQHRKTGQYWPISSSDTILVIDVGGTWIRSGTWTRGEGLLPGSIRKAPTASYLDKEHPDSLGSQLLRMLMQLVPPGTARSSISLGAAIDHAEGTLYASAPLSGADTSAFPIVQRLAETRPETEWHVVNDVTAALLAYRDAAPEASGDKILLTTISTGMGPGAYFRRRSCCGRSVMPVHIRMCSYRRDYLSAIFYLVVLDSAGASSVRGISAAMGRRG